MKKQFYMTTIILTVAMGLLFVCGCSTGSRSQVSEGEMRGVDDSMSLASSNITKYDDAMYNLGQMLDAYGIGSTTIQVRMIDNRTASKKLPADVTQMTITALNKVGSHVRIVDYDQDQLGIDLALGKHTMERIAPDLALRGAITEFDKKVEKESSRGLDISGSLNNNDFDGDASSDADADGTTAAMDFQLLDYKSQILLPGVQAANRINLFSSSSGGGLNLSFAGSGVNFETKIKKTQGMHASLRLLVELSIAELVGKYNRVPYWRCIPDAVADEAAIKSFRLHLSRMDTTVLLKKMLATAHGATLHAFSPDVTEEEEAVFQQMRKQLNVPEQGSDDDFIIALWLTVPIEEGAQNMEGYYARRRQYNEEVVAQLEEAERLKQAELERQRQEQEAAAAAAQEKVNKRTTFKFGKQDTF